MFSYRTRWKPPRAVRPGRFGLDEGEMPLNCNPMNWRQIRPIEPREALPRKEIVKRIQNYVHPFRVTSGKGFDLKEFDPGNTRGLKMEKGKAADLFATRLGMARDGAGHALRAGLLVAPTWPLDRHRSREFIEFLKLLDNHLAHICKEAKAWLAEQPTGRFEFTCTPKHGSWLNLVESFCSSSPARCCAISASHPNRNSRTASNASIASNGDPSFTLGPTSSTKLPDYESKLEIDELEGDQGLQPTSSVDPGSRSRFSVKINSPGARLGSRSTPGNLSLERLRQLQALPRGVPIARLRQARRLVHNHETDRSGAASRARREHLRWDHSHKALQFYGTFWGPLFTNLMIIEEIIAGPLGSATSDSVSVWRAHPRSFRPLV